MRHKLATWLLLLLVFIFIINIIRSSIYLSKRGNIISDYVTQLEEEKDKQEMLKRKLAQVKSNKFIEKEARDKLNLGREGEVVLLMPSISPEMELTPTPIDHSSNPEKWLRLFVK